MFTIYDNPHLHKFIESSPEEALTTAVDLIRTVTGVYPTEDSRAEVTDLFNSTHAELVKTAKIRFRAEGELYQLNLLDTPSQSQQERAAKKRKEVAALQKDWSTVMEAFLDARRLEELTRNVVGAQLAVTLQKERSEQVTLVKQVFKDFLLTATWSQKKEPYVQALNSFKLRF